MKQQQIILAIVLVCLVLGLKAADQPQNVFNRIDYPIGTKLRHKKNWPTPPMYDTIQVSGYERDKIVCRDISSYSTLSSYHSNEALHHLYLPIK